jgi:hypothetical protein
MLAALAAAAGLPAQEARAQDAHLRELRGIEALQISVPTHMGLGAGEPRGQAPCPLYTAVLERRGAESLRAAGLATMTFAERMARERANMAEDRRRLRALQAGDLEAARERPGPSCRHVGSRS